MGYPSTLVFVRHAESESNVIADLDARSQLGKGTQHFMITPLGQKQALNAGTWIRKYVGSFDQVFVSSYRRTRDTLAIMFPEVTPTECALLDEANFGFKHYMLAVEMLEKYPYEFQREALEGRYHYRPAGGESWPDVEIRVRLFLSELRETCANQTVLVVGHGAWYQAFRRVTEGLSIEQTFDAKDYHYIENCGIRVYRGRSAWYEPWNRRTLVPIVGRAPHTPRKATFILPPER